ncbi:hypothetical protein [Streptomyces sp. ISL-10]|nr:hypothetical protein [Streptomyces sp. ISL-10]
MAKLHAWMLDPKANLALREIEEHLEQHWKRLQPLYPKLREGTD